VFVYWELNGQRSSEVERELGPDCRWALRILNLSDGTSEIMAVSGPSGNCYVQAKPRESYGFELGGRSEGKWRTVCRTQRVTMPPLYPGAAARRTADPLRTASRVPEPPGVPGLSIESTPMPPGASSPGSSRS